MFAGALLEKQIVVVCSNLVKYISHSLFNLNFSEAEIFNFLLSA